MKNASKSATIMALSSLISLVIKAFSKDKTVHLGSLLSHAKHYFQLDTEAVNIIEPQGLTPNFLSDHYLKQSDQFSKLSREKVRNVEGFDVYGASVSGTNEGDKTLITLTDEENHSLTLTKRELFIRTAKSLPMQVVKAKADKDGKIKFCHSAKGNATFNGFTFKDDNGNEYGANVAAYVSDKEKCFDKLGSWLYKAAQNAMKGEEEKAYNLVFLAHCNTGIALESLFLTVQARIYAVRADEAKALANKAIVKKDNIVMSAEEANEVIEEKESE